MVVFSTAIQAFVEPIARSEEEKARQETERARIWAYALVQNGAHGFIFAGVIVTLVIGLAIYCISHDQPQIAQTIVASAISAAGGYGAGLARGKKN